MRNIAYLLFSLSLVFLSWLSLSAQGPCISITPDSDSLNVCDGGSVTLTVSGAEQYAWTPAGDFDDPTGSTVVLTPSGSQWYLVTGMIGDSTCYDSVFINLNTNINTFEVSTSTTDTVCPLDIVSVTFLANNPVDSVLWSPTDGVDNTTSITGSDIAPLETTEFIVTAYMQGCEVSDTFTIDVVDFRFRLTTEDTIYLCLGDTGTIRHNMFPTSLDVIWAPLDTTITVLSPANANVYPVVSATYTAMTSFEDCVLSTTTFVRVDSLPDTLLTVIPFKDPYCAGEMVTIFAERADSLKYPDIEFQWFPEDGQIEDSTNTGNVVITVNDTTTFRRVMTQNACVDTSQVTLNVIPPAIPLSVTDTTLCPGDMFMVEILDPDVTDIEWQPATGLSCSDCLNPTVTVLGPQQYMIMAKKEDCPVGASLNVNVFPALPIPVNPPGALACPGDMIQFSIDTTGLTNLNITVNGGTVSCNNCPDPIVTYTGGSISLQVTADETFDNFCGAAGGAVINMKPDELDILPEVIVCEGETTVIPLTQFGFVNPMLSLGNGELSCATCLDPEVTISQSTELVIISDSENPDACQLRSVIPLTIPLDDDASFDLGSEPPFGQGEVVTVTLLTDPFASMFQWIVNGLPLAGNTSSTNVPLNDESNMIHVEWTNSHGCMQEADTTITTVPPYYRIPKAFTPNEEYNTHFRVEIVGNLEIQEMLIFNRWGQKVYEGTSADGWDGRRDGKLAPAEVYAYLIRFRQPNGDVILEKGDVTLIR